MKRFYRYNGHGFGGAFSITSSNKLVLMVILFYLYKFLDLRACFQLMFKFKVILKIFTCLVRCFFLNYILSIYF